jgi:hypothetical protein
MKDIKKVNMGKKSRAQGKAFELRVRKNLEELGWIVCKWSNNVEFEAKKIDNPLGTSCVINNFGKLVGVGHKFNPFTRSFAAGSGFPDFICFKKADCHLDGFIAERFMVQLVESKMTGKLDKTEKEKVEWIKNNLKIPVLVASKNGRGINYEQQ